MAKTKNQVTTSQPPSQNLRRRNVGNIEMKITNIIIYQTEDGNTKIESIFRVRN
jgi:hypothetical protein